jgi:hypothetical protein
MPNPKKIILKGDPLYKERPLKALDVYGVGGITPGMLIESVAGEYTPHATAAGNASPIFAVEAPFREGGDIDTIYNQDGETILAAYCRPGDEVYALLEDGANVAQEALLESNGAGSLQAYTVSGATPLRPVCRALEAVNNSAGGAPARIKVEVI